jgi:hypothetical protein
VQYNLVGVIAQTEVPDYEHTVCEIMQSDVFGATHALEQCFYDDIRVMQPVFQIVCLETQLTTGALRAVDPDKLCTGRYGDNGVVMSAAAEVDVTAVRVLEYAIPQLSEEVIIRLHGSEV